MSISVNDTFIEVTLKEVSKDDQFYDMLQAVANHLQFSLTNSGVSAGIGIAREGFQDANISGYYLLENGNGQLVGLFKTVDGVAKQISPPLPNEIRFVKGTGATELFAPPGWKIDPDPEIQRRFNIGSSPNWIVAALVYIGI